MIYVAKTIKEPSGLIKYLLKFFSMFKISIWYYKDDAVEGFGIKCIDYYTVVGYELEEQT